MSNEEKKLLKVKLNHNLHAKNGSQKNQQKMNTGLLLCQGIRKQKQWIWKQDLLKKNSKMKKKQLKIRKGVNKKGEF